MKACARLLPLCGALLLADARGAMCQRAPGPPPTARVTPDEFAFAFPTPYLRERTPDPAPLGFYVWGVILDGSGARTLVVGPTEPVRTTDLREIARLSTLRLCTSTAGEIMVPRLSDCRTRVPARIEVEAGHLRVATRDSTLLRWLRRTRPATFYRFVIAPAGKLGMEQRAFQYVDY